MIIYVLNYILNCVYSGSKRALCRGLIFYVCVDHYYIFGHGLCKIQTSANC